jgi:hypothetical protein
MNKGNNNKEKPAMNEITATIELYKDEICALLNAAHNQQARYADNPDPTLRIAIAGLGEALDVIHEKEDEAAGI